MAWTDPRTWLTGETPTAALFNAHIRDNLNYLNDDRILGYAARTTDQTGFAGTELDLATCSVTVPVLANRLIRVTGSVLVESDTTNEAQSLVRIRQDGAQIQLSRQPHHTIGTGVGVDLQKHHRPQVVVTPSAGSVVFKLTLQRELGTGALTHKAATTNPGFILVEDIGSSV